VSEQGTPKTPFAVQSKKLFTDMLLIKP